MKTVYSRKFKWLAYSYSLTVLELNWIPDAGPLYFPDMLVQHKTEIATFC